MVLLIRVIKITGTCPVYEIGDEIILEGAKVSGKVCLHALSALTSLLVPLRQGTPPSCFGIGNESKGFLQCPDPGPPHTTGGTVLFELTYNKNKNTDS